MKRTFLYLLLFVYLQSCVQGGDKSIDIETFDEYRTQRIEKRDSLFVLFTVKNWGDKGWYTWGIRSDMYKIKSDDIEYFIGATFYSPDRKKILVWVGEKSPNAPTIEVYNNKNLEANRICPNAKEIVYSMSAIIGIRDSVNKIWDLYPFDQQQAICYDSKEKVINRLGQYYFIQMKNHEMFRMVQSGVRKGHKELQAYGYNIQDLDFWDKCWLFDKDTVGSYGLYPFQIKGYDYIGNKCTQKCAEPFNSPQINYPKEILDLYN